MMVTKISTMPLQTGSAPIRVIAARQTAPPMPATNPAETG